MLGNYVCALQPGSVNTPAQAEELKTALGSSPNKQLGREVRELGPLF